MNKADTTTKLAATEASLKRWQTRLKRAATKVGELDRQRLRYQRMLLNPEPVPVAPVKVRPVKIKMKQIETDHLSEPTFQKLAKKMEATAAAPVKVKVPKETPKAEVIASVAATKAEEPIPAFLNRADPHVAAKLTAARKKAEVEERKKMPLTGKAAMAFIKQKK
jgi:hypothetical protein